MGSPLHQSYLKSMYFFRFGVTIYFTSLFINSRAEGTGGAGGNAGGGNTGKFLKEIFLAFACLVKHIESKY